MEIRTFFYIEAKLMLEQNHIYYMLKYDLGAKHKFNAKRLRTQIHRQTHYEEGNIKFMMIFPYRQVRNNQFKLDFSFK